MNSDNAVTDLLTERLRRLPREASAQAAGVETILKFYLESTRREALSRFNIYELNSSQKS